jgi:hypothetical protein
MAKNKTAAITKNIDDFIATLNSEARGDDVHALIKIYKEVTGFAAKLWGPGIIGFGTHHY